MRRGLLPLLLALEAQVAVAAPPALPELTTVPTTSSFLSPTVRFGRRDVTLEQTTLAQFRDDAGVGTLHRRGEGAEQLQWLCYSLGVAAKGPRIWLWSRRMHGDTIGAITLSSSSSSGEADCPRLPARLKPVQVQDRLALGAASHQVIDLLGRPEGAHAGWWLYGQEDSAPTQGLNRRRYLGAHVSHGKVDELFVEQTTTE